jgi:uncharacterized protein (DUF983 family)
MNSSEKRSRAVVLPLALFVLTILPAIGLLVVALVIWLSSLLGSEIWACVGVGAILLLVAMIIYFVSLRGIVNQLQERVDTIYEVLKIVKRGFDWVNVKISRFWPLPH